MRQLIALISAIGLWVLLVGLGPEREPIPDADRFVALLKAHEFKDAAKSFYVPPAFAGARLVTERAGLANALQLIFREAGGIESSTRDVPPGVYSSVDVGINGGDHPYSPSEIGADDSVTVIYEVRVATEPHAHVALTYAHVLGQWQVLSFALQLPKASPGAAHRAETIMSKLVQSAQRIAQ